MSPLGTTIASAKLDFRVTFGVLVALWHWYLTLMTLLVPVVSTFLYWATSILYLELAALLLLNNTIIYLIDEIPPYLYSCKTVYDTFPTQENKQVQHLFLEPLCIIQLQFQLSQTELHVQSPIYIVIGHVVLIHACTYELIVINYIVYRTTHIHFSKMTRTCAFPFSLRCYHLPDDGYVCF